MNRSFRAEEGRMQGWSRERQQQQVIRREKAMRREKEDELALFMEMSKREKERNNFLHHRSEEFEAPLGLKPGTSPMFSIPSSAATRGSRTDDFLNSEDDKNDYDWLLAPPGTPLFPALEMESQRTVIRQNGTPKARPTSLKSRLSNQQPEISTRTHLQSRQTYPSFALNTSTIGLRRPSSSGGPGSRPSTPTGRPTLTSVSSKPIITNKQNSTALIAAKSLPSVSKSSSTTLMKPSRSSTPTSRPTLSLTKPTVPPRSSTPISRTTPRSSTPTNNRSISLPSSKPVSRSSTPTRRPTNPSPSLSSRNPAPPRPSSPTVKPKWNPSEMPGFSLDAPPNLRTSISDRPPSAQRGRPGAPSSSERIRRQSCSPSRGRPPNNGIKNNNFGGSVPAVSRMFVKANESVSPGLMGTKMVERVVNMRRLVPPKHEENKSPRSNLSGKSSSPDSSGFGRSFSKKSLDMAVRHMDIRKGIQGNNVRTRMTNIPASSMYSVRPGPTRSRTVSVSDSPLATSSNASSEMSITNNGFCVNGSELEDDLNSEKGVRSPPTVRGR